MEPSNGAPLNKMMNAVQVQIISVSVNTPNACLEPSGRDHGTDDDLQFDRDLIVEPSSVPIITGLRSPKESGY